MIPLNPVPRWACGLIATTVLLFLLSGCALRRYQDQITRLEETVIISGNVQGSPDPLVPVIVVLVRQNKGEPEQQRVLEGDGHFSFTCGPGSYYVAAFADANADLAHQPDEWFGWFGNPTMILSEWGDSYADVTIALTPPERATGFIPATDSSVGAMIPNVLKNRSMGDVVTMDDQRFDPENGRVGIWEPIQFIMAELDGIYFLEPYDPDKIPVLFFHGSGSTPKVWAPVIERLDTDRFQPWLMYHPTAVRLGVMADYVASLIRELQLRYQFDRLHIVGHSMGGLIARAAINRLNKEGGARYVQSLTTVSTPWQGHEAAALGVRHSPIVVPSWRDMSSGSSFLESTVSEPLPTGFPHYLLFSYRPKGLSFTGGNSDGTVSIRSQLDYRAQKAAHRIFGFDEDHVSILNSPLLSNRINRILTDQSIRKRRIWRSSPKKASANHRTVN